MIFQYIEPLFFLHAICNKMEVTSWGKISEKITN
jgi:hypothetical protein